MCVCTCVCVWVNTQVDKEFISFLGCIQKWNVTLLPPWKSMSKQLLLLITPKQRVKVKQKGRGVRVECRGWDIVNNLRYLIWIFLSFTTLHCSERLLYIKFLRSRAPSITRFLGAELLYDSVFPFVRPSVRPFVRPNLRGEQCISFKTITLIFCILYIVSCILYPVFFILYFLFSKCLWL